MGRKHSGKGNICRRVESWVISLLFTSYWAGTESGAFFALCVLLGRERGGWFLCCFSSFGSVSERGEISGDLERELGGWLSSFVSKSEEVGSGYLGRWLGEPWTEGGADTFRV